MQRGNRRILIIVVIGAVVTTAGVVGALGPLRSAFDTAATPVGQTLSGGGSGIGGFFRDLGRVGGLARENAALKAENAGLRARVAADAETQRDNQELREQLGLQVAGAPPQVAAEVVTAQPDSYRQFITISRGSSNGIKQGQAVMGGGVLVGLVSAVHDKSATVMLTSDPEFRLAAKVQEGDADGTLRGQLGGGLLMEKIGQTQAIAPGNTVVTAGLGGAVPAGLLVGRVQSVDARDNAIFQSARVAQNPAAGLRFVYVVTP